MAGGSTSNGVLSTEKTVDCSEREIDYDKKRILCEERQEVMNAKISKIEGYYRHATRNSNESYIQAQKLLTSQKMALQEILEKKGKVKSYRQSLNDIDDVYQKEILEQQVHNVDSFRGVLTVQDRLDDVLDTEIRHVDDQRTTANRHLTNGSDNAKMPQSKAAASKSGLCTIGAERTDPTQSRTCSGGTQDIPPILARALPAGSHAASAQVSKPILSAVSQATNVERQGMAGICNTTVSGDKTRDYQSTVNEQERIIDELKAEIIQLKNRRRYNVGIGFSLPQDSKVYVWPTLELQGHHAEQLSDNVEFDGNLMDLILQKLLQDYDATLGARRSHSRLPAEVFKCFLDGTPYIPCDNKPDIITFVQSTSDIFSRQDLYLTALIDGHQHTVVIRNVPRAIERMRRKAGGLPAETIPPRSRREAEKAIEILQSECVMIIYDSDHTKGNTKGDKVHQRIFQAVKKYFLMEAQIQYGQNAFSTLSDIDMHLIVPTVPQQIGYGLNNCGPFSLKYLQLYLRNTEHCCKEVIPKHDANDPFWQPHRRMEFRQDIRTLLCPNWPVLPGQTITSGVNEDESLASGNRKHAISISDSSESDEYYDSRNSSDDAEVRLKRLRASPELTPSQLASVNQGKAKYINV